MLIFSLIFVFSILHWGLQFTAAYDKLMDADYKGDAKWRKEKKEELGKENHSLKPC